MKRNMFTRKNLQVHRRSKLSEGGVVLHTKAVLTTSSHYILSRVTYKDTENQALVNRLIREGEGNLQ